jgi:hypothetical protein
MPPIDDLNLSAFLQTTGANLDAIGQMNGVMRHPGMVSEFLPDGIPSDPDAPLTRTDLNPIEIEEAPTASFDPRTGTTYQGFRFPGNVVQDPRIPAGTIALVNNNCHMVLMAPDGRTVECDIRDVMLSPDPTRAMGERIALKAGEFGTGSIRGTLQMSPEAHRRLMQTFGFTEDPKPAIAPEEDLFEDRTW